MKKKNMKMKMKMKDGESCGSSSCKDPCGGCAYFLGFIGAAIYYISTATGFWNGVVGVLQAAVWPLFLVFELLQSAAA